MDGGGVWTHAEGDSWDLRHVGPSTGHWTLLWPCWCSEYAWFSGSSTATEGDSSNLCAFSLSLVIPESLQVNLAPLPPEPWPACLPWFLVQGVSPLVHGSQDHLVSAVSILFLVSPSAVFWDLSQSAQPPILAGCHRRWRGCWKSKLRLFLCLRAICPHLALLWTPLFWYGVEGVKSGAVFTYSEYLVGRKLFLGFFFFFFLLFFSLMDFIASTHRGLQAGEWNQGVHFHHLFSSCLTGYPSTSPARKG